MGGTYSQGICYSKPVSKKRDGETEIYRHPDYIDGLLLSPKNQKDILTMQDVFLYACKTYPHKRLLGSRESIKSNYFWKTYTDCLSLAEQLGSGMINLNIPTHVNEYDNLDMKLVGIFAKNREEWLILEYANFLYNNTMVPFYDTLGQESIGFILEQTNLESIFCQGQAVESLLKCQNTYNLKNIILLDDISDEVQQKANQRNWKITHYKDVMKAGSTDKKPYAKVSPSDVLTFSYTSGTTGNPKGALLSHKNIVSVVATGSNEGFNSNDCYISYLPLPHILERIFVSTILFYGGSLGFYGGDVMKLKDDLAVLRPTIFVSVPRLYNRFYDAIKTNIDKVTGFKAKLAKKALATKLQQVKTTGEVTHSLWDSLVFKKSKLALGGRVRWAGTGSAPISGETLNFLKATLCIPIAEGYGQTESCGASFATHVKDPVTGHVGGCRGNYEFKLVDIPDMNYTSLDKDADGNLAPRGEICIRGNGVFIGYYKEPEKTKEALDDEGWLHTGDVGQLNVSNGSVRIIDRKKNIFKLAQGEYIAPEKIENIYIKAKGVAEVFLHGDSLESCVLVIAVPDKKYITEYAKQNNIPQADDYEALCQNEDIKSHLLTNMTKLGRSENLFGFEQAKAIYLEPISLVELDCMTTTFKIKRQQAKVHFKKQIEEMYAKINASQAGK